MKKSQRVALASRLRQLSELSRAGVSMQTALCAAAADNPVAGNAIDGQLAPGSVGEFVPASMPQTRALLASADRGVSDVLAGAAADVLDEPGNRSAGRTVLYVSVIGAVLVVFLFSVFVAPTFKDMFDSFGTQLPAPTILALFLAQWVIGPLGALMLLLVVVKAVWTFRPELLGRIAPKIDSMFMKAPLLGHATRVIQTKRLAAWLAANGTRGDLTRRLDSLVELAGPGQFSRQVTRLAKAVQGGQSLLEATAAPGWLPGLAMVLRDAANADTDADDVTKKKLFAYANGLDVRSDALTARLTLFAQLIVGVVIGFFVVAMYLPIFKMGSAI